MSQTNAWSTGKNVQYLQSMTNDQNDSDVLYRAVHGGGESANLPVHSLAPASFLTWFESRFIRLLHTLSHSSVMVGSAI